MYRRLNVIVAGESFWVEGDYQKGYPPSGPTYSCGGEPGENPSFTLEGLFLEHKDGHFGLPCHVSLNGLLKEEAFSAQFLEKLEAEALERIQSLGQ